MTHPSFSMHGAVAVLTLNKPPVNGLGHALRSGLLQALDRALADPQVKAIVLTGGETLFSAGADVTEFGTPRATLSPNLGSVINALELSPKPVVAAIAGNCLGGGLELAMGCHWRVARRDAQLGLPEVKLGLLPGAGGTQRLPRAIGLEAALNVIYLGQPQRAAGFEGTVLVDELTDGPVLPVALALAERVLAEGLVPRRLRDLPVRAPAADALLQFARNQVRASYPNLPAPLQCVEAVAASVSKPFEQGLQFERELFLRLMQTPESRALRHAFGAERAAAHVDGMAPGTVPWEIRRAGVIGAGTMGSGIAMVFANAGVPVALLETSQEALDRGMNSIRANYTSALKKGKLQQAEMDARIGLIRPALTYDALADADLVVEAVFESMEVKRAVFEQLNAVLRPGAILASNTSALDLNQIAAFTQRPQDVIGLHFFSPANQMRLLEVVRGAKTSDQTLVSSMALAKRLGKVAVVSGVCDGFIGNRMLMRYDAAACGLLELGASPAQVDKALERFGFAMGRFRVADLAGLDIGWAGRKRRAAAQPEKDFSAIPDRLCEIGRYGQKTGAGWYRYESGSRAALPDPAVDQIIQQWRTDKALTPRRVDDREIIERCVYALINEGARILEDGIAQRASDIDVVYLNGYGFPRFRGGVMRYADEVGLPNVLRALRRALAESPQQADIWTPSPLLVRLADEGKTFN